MMRVSQPMMIWMRSIGRSRLREQGPIGWVMPPTMLLNRVVADVSDRANVHYRERSWKNFNRVI